MVLAGVPGPAGSATAATCRHPNSALLMIRKPHWKSLLVLPTFRAYLSLAFDPDFPAKRA
jgi:hypothetical protein